MSEWEVNELVDEVKKLESQLKEANEVIEFYADKENWGDYRNNIEDNDFLVILNDSENIEVQERGQIYLDKYGGKKAREYKSKFGLE